MTWSTIRKIKNIEPLLGLFGLIYVLLLLAAAGWLVNFMVRGTLNMLVPAAVTKQPPTVFNIERASMILEGRGINIDAVSPELTPKTSVTSTKR